MQTPEIRRLFMPPALASRFRAQTTKRYGMPHLLKREKRYGIPADALAPTAPTARRILTPWVTVGVWPAPHSPCVSQT